MSRTKCFPRFEYHILRSISISDLFTDSLSYIIIIICVVFALKLCYYYNIGGFSRRAQLRGVSFIKQARPNVSQSTD
jgi:hypothetical protein